jgi:type IV fimbrial biogenesis protein FimT
MMTGNRVPAISVQSGFTLIELLLVVAILGTLVTLAVPGFGQLFSQVSSNAQARNLMSSLNFARSEAIRRSTTVVVCATDDGSDCSAGAWSQGWLVFVDNDGNASGGSGSVAAGDEILRVYQPAVARNVVSFNRPLVRYDSFGFSPDSNANRRFVICPADADVNNASAVTLSVNGRAARTGDNLVC